MTLDTKNFKIVMQLVNDHNVHVGSQYEFIVTSKFIGESIMEKIRDIINDR